MYEITIRDTESEERSSTVTTSAFMCVTLKDHEGDESSVRCDSAADKVSTLDLLKVIIGLDELKERYFRDHPVLRFAYAIKDDIFDGMEKTDVSGLADLLRKFKSEEES